MGVFFFFFFFSSRRRHTRFDCDWSSDVCSFPLAEDAREHLRRERGAAHAQEDAVPELLRGLPREGRELGGVVLAELRRVEPAEPGLGHVLRAPERRVAGPEARADLLLADGIEPRGRILLAPAQALAQLRLLREGLRPRPCRDRVQEAVERLGEEIEALFGQ